MSATDPGDWQRIDELFAAALEVPADRRTAFLEQACGEDSELRREVESLLLHHREDGLLERPAVEWAAAVVAEDGQEDLVGRRLGRFEVTARLGAGAMGEVYLAHDPRLHRQVALKILPPHLASDPERIERFRREALAVSALNHPNILTVHEVAEVEGRELMVCERIEGVTLRERLRQGPLPVAKALDVGAQIARGLAAAHRLGIVHRDVKPENVMIRGDGLVKILDFGLAKSVARPQEAAPTEAGRILGTASYMSPEQARGETASVQSDLWALGCVLYETLTGRQAFEGGTTSDVLAAVLKEEPAWEDLPAETPWLARSLLRRCLQKDPDRRLHDASDARLELEEAARDGPEAKARAVSGRRPPWLLRAVAGLAALAVLVAAGTALHQLRPAPATPLRFELPHPTGGRFYHVVEATTMALSPDGRLFGYISVEPPGPSTSIWIRPLAELAARPVEGTDGAASLFWSPDGKHLGFVADGKLKRVPVEGGSPIPLCDVDPGSGVSGTWGRDSILFASVQGGTIYRVSPNGGEAEAVVRTEEARHERRVVWPWFLPDGERFLYLAIRDDGRSELRLVGARGVSRRVGSMASRVEIVEPDLAVFVREGALIAQRLDADRAELVGAPRPLAPTVRAFGTNGWAAFATARRGTVVMATQDDLHRLALVDREGRTVREIGAAMTANSMAVSPDGQRAIVARLRPGLATWDLWVVDLDRGVESRLTNAPGTEVYARWLPGGRAIVYSATYSTVPNLVLHDLASGAERRLVPQGQFQIAVAVTPDGGRVLYRQRTPDGFELLSVPLDGRGPPARVLRPGVFVMDAALSPDGRVLAYVSSESGRPELFIRLLGVGEAVRVSEHGAWAARFAADGETLYYTTADRNVAAVPVTASPGLAVGRSETFFSLGEHAWTDFHVLPDGRFLALVRETDSSLAPLTVLAGWNRPGDGG